MAQFRLQRILDYRHRRTEALKREFDEAKQCLKRETALLEQIQTEACLHSERFEATQGTAVLGDELQMAYRAYRHLQQQIAAQEAVTQQAEAVAEARRQTLIKAQQDKRMLEKLKEKEKRRDFSKRAMHEQHRLDELMMTRSHYERKMDPGDRCS